MMTTETIQEQRRRPGRPRKGEVRSHKEPKAVRDLHVEVSIAGADAIARLAKILGVSQGVAIEYAARMAEQQLCSAA